MTELPEQFEVKSMTKGHSSNDEWKGREADASRYWPEFKFIQLQARSQTRPSSGINLDNISQSVSPILVTQSLDRFENTTCSNTAFSLFLSVLPCVKGLVFTDTAAEQPQQKHRYKSVMMIKSQVFSKVPY